MERFTALTGVRRKSFMLTSSACVRIRRTYSLSGGRHLMSYHIKRQSPTRHIINGGRHIEYFS